MSALSTTGPSKAETLLSLASKYASYIFFRHHAASIESAALAAGQACLAHPSIIVAGAVGTIAVKELGPKVAPYVMPVLDPVVSLAEKHPKTTLVATSAICAKLLPFAASGEPLAVTATGISCTAAAAAYAAYLLSGSSSKD